jgi:SAM-dependent methyltransferase
MRELLLRTYWRMAGVILPEARHSEFVYEEVVHDHTASHLRRLDVGCGRYLIPPWRRENAMPLPELSRSLVGVDPDLAALADNREVPVRCAGFANNLPFADESFDLVTANMVVEHLREPVVEFREVARVLKPGGVFVFHTPNARGYPTLLARALPEVIKKRVVRMVDGRPADEVYPAYYRANTRRSLEALARSSGFTIVELRHSLTAALAAAILPIALIELLVMRLLSRRRFESLRPTIVGVMRKQPALTRTDRPRDSTRHISARSPEPAALSADEG